LQRPEANLDALRVKQATARFPLERRRGSTVPPAPTYPFNQSVGVSKLKYFMGALARAHARA
jgi:hypothetical protein